MFNLINNIFVDAIGFLFNFKQAGDHGHSHVTYPRWVWTLHGGYGSQARNQVRNTAFMAGLLGLTCVGAFFAVRDKERITDYPNRWIPLMLYGKDFHDPTCVEYWKEYCKTNNKTWIEPYPTWWPSSLRRS